mgnify:CR=1 FL=1
MALRTFETDDAVYYLGLGNHLTSSEPIFRNVDLSDLDFFVFEDGYEEDHSDKSFLENELSTHRQYSGLFRKLKTESPETKVYGVDITQSIIDIPQLPYRILDSIPIPVGIGLIESSIRELSKNPSRRAFLKGIVGTFLTSDIAMLVNSGESEISPIVNYYNTKSNLPLLSPETSLRDAAIAKKLHNI